MLPKMVRGMHWLSVLAIFLALGLAWLHDTFDDDAVSDWIIGMHRQLGLLVLSLWVVRLMVRWYHRKQRDDVALPLMLRLAGAASHSVMYLTLLAMPLLGWAMTNAQGYPVLALNIFALPTLVAADPDLADSLQDWHEWGAWVLIAVVSVHVLAALWHHLVRRDGVLAAMLPLVRRRAPR
ncbi:MAG: cytochrome b561 [Janthinobacterium sp.]|jgi:cytochrome b561